MEWKPIETAPKNGILVDLWVNVTGGTTGSRAVEYHYDQDFGDWVDSDRRRLSDAYLNDGVHASYWMPTPLPPPK